MTGPGQGAGRSVADDPAESGGHSDGYAWRREVWVGGSHLNP